MRHPGSLTDSRADFSTKTMIAVLVSIGFVVVCVLAFILGMTGIISVADFSTKISNGEALSTAGRGNGFLPEWELAGELSDPIRADFHRIAPEWILIGEDAAQEHLIEQMTGEILHNLPENVEEAAKDKIAPRIYISGTISCDSTIGIIAFGEYSFKIDLRVRVAYSEHIVARSAILEFNVRIRGFYPKAKIKPQIAARIADMIVDALNVMYKEN